ncbi:phosphohistidine phosphatase SixA, partial [Candidatus Riflebacteria bacterium]
LLFLVQHGDAKSKATDPERLLSKAGKEQVRNICYFFEESGFEVENIFHSGKERARETAEILGEAFKLTGDIEKRDNLNPMDPPEAWAEKLKNQTRNLMLVGHLPHLSELASLLLGLEKGKKAVNIQNAGVLCLKRDEAGCWAVDWMIVPRLFEEPSTYQKEEESIEIEPEPVDISPPLTEEESLSGVKKWSHDFSDGALIIKEGEEVEDILLLKKGEIQVFVKKPGEKKLEDGSIEEKSVVISTIKEGQTLLELEALINKKCHFSLRAWGNCTIEGLDTQRIYLQPFLESNFDLNLTMVKNLAYATYNLRQVVKDVTHTLQRFEEVLADYYRHFFLTFPNMRMAKDDEYQEQMKELFELASQKEIYQKGLGLRLKKELAAESLKNEVYRLENPHGMTQFKEKIKNFKTGEYIFKEDDPGDSMYILMEGALEGLINDEPEFEIHGEGSVVGELALISSLVEEGTGARTADIRCKTPSKLMVVDKLDFISFVSLRREFLSELVFTLQERAISSQIFFEEHRDKIGVNLAYIFPQVENDYMEIRDKIKNSEELSSVFQDKLVFFEEQLQKIERDKEDFQKLYEKFAAF